MTQAPSLAEWEALPHFTLQITGRCNLACPDCIQRREGRDMPRDEVVRNAQRLQREGYQRVALLGGEPTLHPDLPAITDDLRGLGLKVSVTTNGANREAVTRLPLDRLAVTALLPGWEEMAEACPGRPVAAHILVRRGEGEIALEHAARAARRGFRQAVFLPSQARASARPSPPANGYPAPEDLHLLLLAEPWLAEMGLRVAFGCAALRTLGLTDACPPRFRMVDLDGQTTRCAFAACPHREPTGPSR